MYTCFVRCAYDVLIVTIEEHLHRIDIAVCNLTLFIAILIAVKSFSAQSIVNCIVCDAPATFGPQGSQQTNAHAHAIFIQPRLWV